MVYALDPVSERSHEEDKTHCSSMADYSQHAVKLREANQYCTSFRGGDEIAYFYLIAETCVISHDRLSVRATLP